MDLLRPAKTENIALTINPKANTNIDSSHWLFHIGQSLDRELLFSFSSIQHIRWHTTCPYFRLRFFSCNFNWIKKFIYSDYMFHLMFRIESSIVILNIVQSYIPISSIVWHMYVSIVLYVPLIDGESYSPQLFWFVSMFMCRTITIEHIINETYN